MTATIIKALVALTLSGLFSGLEIAYVSSSKLRIEMDRESGGLASRALGLFYAKPANFISMLLVGNNIALVVFGLLMSELITPLLNMQGALLLLCQTLIATAVVLVFGEFLPKTLFRLNPNASIRAFAPLAWLFYVVLWPLSKLTSALSRLVLRTFGVRVQKGTQQTFKRADLDHLVQDDESDEVRIFQRALDFRDVKVRESLVPRTEVCAAPMTASVQELRAKFVESGHSKVIIYKDDIDDIMGFVHSSEMFTLTDQSDWRHCVREMPIVPESMSAQKLMKQLMSAKRSIAVVVDEFGGTAGIVTLEDLVEEIVGEVEDEHDHDNQVAKRLPEGDYLLAGRLEIERANEQLGLSLPTSEDYLTVGGLILNRHQSFPRTGDVIRFAGYEVRILRSTTTRIELVRLKVCE